MQPTTNERRPENALAVELGERLQTLRGHLEAVAELARQGLSVALRSQDSSFEQFFRRCAHDLERMGRDSCSLEANAGTVAGAQLAPTEQVSAATFAPGDGANDAQVTPEAARGKPGNWPAY
jgi:hypothetical protein